MVTVELSKKDMYDFKVKNVKVVKEINGKKLITKYKEAIFKNEDIHPQRVYRFDLQNVPSSLKNIEVIDAPFPFYKTLLDHPCYYDWDWSISTVIYAFKLGLIDGFCFSHGGLFSPFWEISAIAYIVIDPIKRLEVREYINKEFETFINNIHEEDFEYGIKVKKHFRDTRVGKSKDSSVEKILEEIKKDHEEHKAKGEEYYRSPHEKEALKKYGEEKVDMALAHLLFYHNDFGISRFSSERNVDVLSFKSLEEANKFCNEYNGFVKLYHNIDDKEIREYENMALPMIVNDRFDKFMVDYDEKVVNS